MATENYNLPTITGNMTADVVRDVNALAEATDAAIKDAVDGVDLTQIEQSVTDLQTEVTEHLADYVKHPPFAVATGTANNYVVTLNPIPTEYVDGMGVIVAINVDATGASTLNVNGLGAVPIKKANGTDVTNLKMNGVYTLRYSTGNFILQGEGGSGNALASDLLSGKTASTDAGDIVGTMPNRGTFNLGLGVSVPSGYYSGGTTANGKRWASGRVNMTIGVNYEIVVRGLSFKPSFVIAQGTGASINNSLLIGTDGTLNLSINLYESNDASSYNQFYADGFKLRAVNSPTFDWIAFE